MAYDEQLAARISDLMHARPGVVERKMFGGMGWTIGGNMAVGVMRTDHMVVRLPPEEIGEAIRDAARARVRPPGSEADEGLRADRARGAGRRRRPGGVGRARRRAGHGAPAEVGAGRPHHAAFPPGSPAGRRPLGGGGAARRRRLSQPVRDGDLERPAGRRPRALGAPAVRRRLRRRAPGGATQVRRAQRGSPGRGRVSRLRVVPFPTAGGSERSRDVRARRRLHRGPRARPRPARRGRRGARPRPRLFRDGVRRGARRHGTPDRVARGLRPGRRGHPGPIARRVALAAFLRRWTRPRVRTRRSATRSTRP